MSATERISSIPGYERISRKFEDSGLNVGLLFILPAFVMILLLLLYPMINTIWISLQETTGVGLSLENYRVMFASDWFIPVVRNSVVWVVLGTLLQIAVGFGFALLLNTQLPGKKFLRGLYLLPWITPVVVVALVFSWMYSPQFGIINSLLVQVGILNSSIAWLSQPDTALFALIIAATWKRFPFVMIMLLAGLQDVDDQLQNAAIIDGAPYWARMRHVTLPQLLPVLKIVLLLSVIWCFNQFAIIYTATGGGPLNATMTFPVKVYELAFGQLDFGLSTALSVLMFGVMLLFMVLYMRVLRTQGVEL